VHSQPDSALFDSCLRVEAFKFPSHPTAELHLKAISSLGT